MSLSGSIHRFVVTLVLSLILFSGDLRGQQGFLPPAPQLNKQRLTGVIITESVVGAVTMVALDRLWYRKHSRSKFHRFNDNGEWLGMDKVGHATTAYNICTLQSDIFRWTGLSPGRSALYAGITALSFQSMIEIFDGFSSGWGFSTGDMVANLSGIALFSAQQAIWGRQMASLQFSFHTSPYAIYNPDLLGHRFSERILKDYNGQTYWLTLNLPAIFPSSGIPTWLNASIGYGASGMIGARSNPDTIKGIKVPVFSRERRFLLAVSPTLSYTPPSSVGVSALKFLNTPLKMPAPVIEYRTRSGIKLHPFYF